MNSIKIESIKEFMSLLLSAGKFDDFFVMDTEIRTFITTKINGSLQKEWLAENGEEEQELNEYVSWKQIRPIVYDLVKGKKPPSVLIINFIKMMKNSDKGILRVQYINGELNVISAYQAAVFTLDKEAENLWDEWCSEWLSKGID